MTTQETLKKRVRARMSRTGERYTTARKALLAKQANGSNGSNGKRPWVSPPEMSDDAVANGTGHGWDHWCDLIDGWKVDPWDHPSVAARLQAEEGLDGWWSQSVTVGYERITGIRLPGQMADGTFAANKSRTVQGDPDELRTLLLDENSRNDLFPGVTTQLVSKPEAKAIRLRVGPGDAVISLQPVDGGRTKVAIQHKQLPTADDVDRWKFWWGEWLNALAEDS